MSGTGIHFKHKGMGSRIGNMHRHDVFSGVEDDRWLNLTYELFPTSESSKEVAKGIRTLAIPDINSKENDFYDDLKIYRESLCETWFYRTERGLYKGTFSNYDETHAAMLEKLTLLYDAERVKETPNTKALQAVSNTIDAIVAVYKGTATFKSAIDNNEEKDANKIIEEAKKASAEIKGMSDTGSNRQIFRL